MIRTTAMAIALVLAGSGAAGAQNPATANPSQVRVRYMVNDIPSSVAFYTGQLGFRLDMQSGPYFAALSRGGVQLLLSPVNGPGGASKPMPNGDRPVPGGWTRVVIYVSDLKGEVERLRKAGVPFRNDIVDGLGGDEILLNDPSGNPVELFQPG